MASSEVTYEVRVKRSAEKELRDLPARALRRVVERIQALAEDPRPNGCEKLSGEEKYRLRQGDYRILYAIDDDSRRVEVVRIGHRRDVYR